MYSLSDDAGYAEYTFEVPVETWVWDQVRDGTMSDGTVFYLDLEAEEHTLTIKQREDRTKIDRILVTNDMEYVPQGMGEEVP